MPEDCQGTGPEVDVCRRSRVIVSDWPPVEQITKCAVLTEFERSTDMAGAVRNAVMNLSSVSVPATEGCK